MRVVLMLLSFLLLVGCGEKAQPGEEANQNPPPGEESLVAEAPEPAPESRELPPLPETVTAEFIMGLWAKPHDGTEVMEELKDFVLKPGVWKWVRNIGPRKGELKERREASMANKVVDRRFIVRQFTFDGGAVYGVVTYDHAVEGYRWWELLPDGFINEISGKPYRRNLLEWISVRIPDEDVQFRKRETVNEKELWEATFEVTKGEELVAYAEDEARWVAELPEPQVAPEEE